MTAIEHISDSEEIVNVSWSTLQHDSAAALILSEISPLPQAVSAKDLLGVRTPILNVCRIKRIDQHPAEI